jgi:uncharacterized protein
MAPASRLLSLDALRGVALCGILLVNIFRMGGPIAMERPLSTPALGDGDWQIWIIAGLFVTGTMRGLFSLLFGVGLMIFVSGEGSAGRVRLYRRRLVLLLLFGIIDSTLLLWPGDILIIYALAGLIALLLHRLRPAWLLGAAGLIMLLISVWAAFEAASIAPSATVYTPQMIAREAAARLGDYGQNLTYMSWWSFAWTFDALTWRWIGDGAAMMLIGMVLYRRGMFAEDLDPRLMLWLTVVGYGLGLALRTTHILLVMGHDGGPTFVSALIDQPGRLAMTLGHVGLFQLLWRRFMAPRAKTQLALMGRMALTLYLGQSLMAAFIFSGFGLGMWGRLSWAELWLVGVAMILTEAVSAALWFRLFSYGPMEWLWRWGTYGKWP